MRARVASVVVTLTVLLAGCSGGLDGLALSKEQPTQTSPEQHVAAPGLNTSGVTDARRLAGAHTASLKDRSFTRRVVISGRSPDGSTPWRIIRTLKMGPDHRRFVFEQRATGEFPASMSPRTTGRVWSGGNLTIVSFSEGDRTVYFESTNRLTFPMFDGEAAILEFLGPLGEASVREVAHDGWVAYRIEGANASTDVEMVAIVDSFGLLHEFRLTAPPHTYARLTGDRWTGAGPVQLSLQYEAIGSTTFERPAWTERPGNATGGVTGLN